jgi:hypothetical protein
MGCGERHWESGNTRCEVVLPRLDYTFGRVGVVHVGGGALKFYLFRRNECFDVVGHLIVHFVEEGPITPGCEPGIHLRNGPEEFFLGPDLDGYQPNGICIVDIEEGNVGIASVGCHQEAPGIVAGDASPDDVHRHEDVVSSYVFRLLWHVVHVGVNSVRREDNWRGCCGGLCGPLALVDLVHVPLF